MEDILFIRVGLIINTHGVKGELKVMPLTDDKQRFKTLKSIFLEIGSVGSYPGYDVEGVKFPAEFVSLKLKGIDSVEQAQKLKGKYVCVSKSEVAELPEDSFYIFDLIGCEVFDENGGLLGIVTDVLSTGSNDVYVVKKEGRTDLLLPALKAVIKQVDIAARKIVADVPEGLVDDE